jgi:hypothetical protein
MTADQLNEAIDDLIHLVTDLSKVMPNKVPAGFLTFLETAKADEWVLDLLVNSLNNLPQNVTPQARRR